MWRAWTPTWLRSHTPDRRLAAGFSFDWCLNFGPVLDLLRLWSFQSYGAETQLYRMDERVMRLVSRVSSIVVIATWIWAWPLPLTQSYGYQNGNSQYHHYISVWPFYRAGSWLRPGTTAVPQLCSWSIRERSKPSQPFYHNTMITMQSQRSRSHPNHPHFLWPFYFAVSVTEILSEVELRSISGDPLQHCLLWWEWRLHQECKLRIFHSKNLDFLTVHF